jgi:hypothetical protein
MAASPSKAAINARLRRLRRKYPDASFRVLRASNGEVAIMRCCPHGADPGPCYLCQMEKGVVVT